MSKIGYVRVSTQDQNLDSQILELTKYGVDYIYQEKASGKNTKDRPVFNEMMGRLREGDTLAVWDITRLGRSIADLIGIVGRLKEVGVEFAAIKNNIDTSTPSGRLTFHLFAAIAEYDREMIRERTMAGLSAAKQRGKTLGRPKNTSEEYKNNIIWVFEQYKKKVDAEDIAAQLNIHKSSVYRLIEKGKQLCVN